MVKQCQAYDRKIHTRQLNLASRKSRETGERAVRVGQRRPPLGPVEPLPMFAGRWSHFVPLAVNLRILVHLVIYDSGWVSLEHVLLSWYPSFFGGTPPALVVPLSESINPFQQGNVLFGSDNALRLWDLRTPHAPPAVLKVFFFFFFLTFVTGPTRSLSLKLTDTRVYEPQIRARLVTTAHVC